MLYPVLAIVGLVIPLFLFVRQGKLESMERQGN